MNAYFTGWMETKSSVLFIDGRPRVHISREDKAIAKQACQEWTKRARRTRRVQAQAYWALRTFKEMSGGGKTRAKTGRVINYPDIMKSHLSLYAWNVRILLECYKKLSK